MLLLTMTRVLSREVQGSEMTLSSLVDEDELLDDTLSPAFVCIGHIVSHAGACFCGCDVHVGQTDSENAGVCFYGV